MLKERKRTPIYRRKGKRWYEYSVFEKNGEKWAFLGFFTGANKEAVKNDILERGISIHELVVVRVDSQDKNTMYMVLSCKNKHCEKCIYHTNNFRICKGEESVKLRLWKE